MRIRKIRYIVHPNDVNNKFFHRNDSHEFKEIVAHIETDHNQQIIEQIHDRLTVRLKNKGYVRYTVHPDDAFLLGLEVGEELGEIRVLFDEDEKDGKAFIAQVNKFATVPDDTISSNVYGEIKINR
ncbi:MAG: hypothetical protein RRZ92_04375 [Bacilli bacterium]